MTASITGRKRCSCGQYKTPLANGTMPNHTYPSGGVLSQARVHCHGSGQLPPMAQRSRKADDKTTTAPKSRGGRRASKRDTKNKFKRNAAGGFNGRPGSAGTAGK